MKKIILSLFLALQLACTPLLSLTAQSAPITYEAGISQNAAKKADDLSLIHISEPTRP